MRIVASALLAAVAATVVAASGGVASSQGVGTPAGVARTAYTVEPFTPAAPITIQGQGVRLRAEPFATKDTPVLSSGSTGLQLNIVGVVRQSDWDWYQVVLRNGQKAYIRSDLTTAPSRGTAVSAVTNVPSQPAPQVVATPPRQTPALPPITPQPQQNTGAISLTPRDGGQPLPSVTPAPVDSGLLSISPSAPAPKFTDPTPASGVATTPVTASSVPATMANLGLAEQIRAQLNFNRCWTDSSSMMDAQRLKASFGVTFGPDGRFASEPRLIMPAAEPSSDPAMMVFIAKARAAMRTCNAIGFYVPPAYYSGDQCELVLEFSAR